MESDSDVPGIHAEACDLVVAKALTYVYDRLKNPADRTKAENEYARLLKQHAKRYGVGVPASAVLKKRPARA